MTGRRSQKRRKSALMEGISAGVLFGTAAVLIRFLKGNVGAFSIALWRLVIASIAISLAILLSKQSFHTSFLRRGLGRILVLGILLGTHFILFVSAVLDTTIINATVLVNTTPIWSMFMSSLVFKLKPSRWVVIGIAVSFLGVFVITYADASSTTLTVQLRGDVEATLAAVVEAFYLSYGRDTRQKAPLLPLMLAIYLVSAVTVLTAGTFTASALTFPLEFTVVLALIGLGILPTAMAHSLYFSSLSNLKSFETATMALLEPVGATLLGILIFAQIPKPLFVVGASFVLVGIISVALKE